VDQRLCMPEPWCPESYQERRNKCTVPEDVTCPTPPQVAAAMVAAIAHEELRPCKDIVADGLYGHSHVCLDAVDACVGSTAWVAVPSETRGWLPRPRTADQSSREKGEARGQRVGVDLDSAPSTVATVAARLPASRGDRRKVSEGTQGPSVDELARPRVTLCQGGLPARTIWLGIKRTFSAEPAYPSSLSNAPASPPLSTFVWVRGLRWAVAPCFAEGQTELGLDHYAVRKYAGWHHQRVTTMLAHVFLGPLKRHVGKKSSGPHRGTGADVLGGRHTPVDLYDGRGAGVRRVGAAAPSPGVSSASSAAARRRMTLWREEGSAIEIIFVVYNSVQARMALPETHAAAANRTRACCRGTRSRG
jgi:SRSO17 transposase